MRLWAAAALLVPALALANGRPPRTNGVFARPGDDHNLLVRTTFGLLVSHDDGCSFHWVCEKAVGYGGEFDPKYAIAADGSMFATTFTGLRVSRDGGCSWATATSDRPAGDPGKISELWIDAIDIGPTGEVWVATAESAKANNLFYSTDNGVTFQPTGLSSPVVWYKSIKIAPTDARRIYATSYQVATTAQAHLYRTDDAGGGWHELPLFGADRAHPTMRFGTTPLVYVVGVDPGDPDIVYLTSIGANPPSGDVLYRSSDGGHAFLEVLATTDPIRDVVVSPTRVWVATIAGGSFESSTGTAFRKLATTPQLACLGRRSDGSLVGCGANWAPDFMAIAGSVDAVSWNKLARFGELAGTLECPAGTQEHDVCGPMWPALRAQFGATGPGVCHAPAAKAPAPDAAAPPKKPPAGCCDAGEGAPVGLALVVGVLVVRPRRRA